jgi:hypothetical protein
MRLMNIKRCSSLYLKGLIVTGEQVQEQGPGLTTNDLGDTVATNDVCFTQKNKNATKHKP